MIFIRDVEIKWCNLRIILWRVCEATNPLLPIKLFIIRSYYNLFLNRFHKQKHAFLLYVLFGLVCIILNCQYFWKWTHATHWAGEPILKSLLNFLRFSESRSRNDFEQHFLWQQCKLKEGNGKPHLIYVSFSPWNSLQAKNLNYRT